MNLKAIKGLYTLLTLVFTTGLVPILNNANAQGHPKIYVDPVENKFFLDTTSVGATFDVSIKSADWVEPGVYSYEFKLSYDKTMLEATAAAIPTGHWLTPTLSPGNIFPVDTGTINKNEGYVSFAVTLLGAEPGKTGGGTFATVTLKITAAPPLGGSLSSTIAVTNLVLADPTATQIPSANYDVIPATFLYATPPPPWHLKVEPKVVAANAVGDEVTININVYDVKPEARIVGVQFKIVIPGILWTQEEWVRQGPFFEIFGDKIFAAYVEIDAQGRSVVLVLVFLLPDENGTWGRFPEGNGTLTTIQFNVTYLPEKVTKFPIILSDVIMVDPDGNMVSYHPSEGGVLIAPTKLEDVNLDGKVNIQDMASFALAYGSSPGHPRWKPKADVNRDGKVNILDGVRIAKALGWVPPDPP